MVSLHAAPMIELPGDQHHIAHRHLNACHAPNHERRIFDRETGPIDSIPRKKERRARIKQQGHRILDRNPPCVGMVLAICQQGLVANNPAQAGNEMVGSHTDRSLPQPGLRLHTDDQLGIGEGRQTTSQIIQNLPQVCALHLCCTLDQHNELHRVKGSIIHQPHDTTFPTSIRPCEDQPIHHGRR